MKAIAIALVMLFAFVLPAAAQEGTPEAAIPALTETHISRHNLVSFAYPEGWTIRETPAFNAGFLGFISNDPETTQTSTIEYGKVLIFLHVTEDMTYATLPRERRLATLGREIRNNFKGVVKQQTVSPNEAVNFSEIAETSVGDKPAVEFSLSSPELAMWYMAIEERENVYTVIWFSGTRAEIENWKLTVLEIAASIQLLRDPLHCDTEQDCLASELNI